MSSRYAAYQWMRGYWGPSPLELSSPLPSCQFRFFQVHPDRSPNKHSSSRPIKLRAKISQEITTKQAATTTDTTIGVNHTDGTRAMNSRVTKSLPFLVGPAEPTPAGTVHLTDMDTALASLTMTAVLVYDRPVDQPAETIRRAMSRALVHYYPVAGRLVGGGAQGELKIACTGDGVAFVGASASCALRDAGLTDRQPAVSVDDLTVVYADLHHADAASGRPLALVQGDRVRVRRVRGRGDVGPRGHRRRGHGAVPAVRRRPRPRPRVVSIRRPGQGGPPPPGAPAADHLHDEGARGLPPQRPPDHLRQCPAQLHQQDQNRVPPQQRRSGVVHGVRRVRRRAMEVPDPRHHDRRRVPGRAHGAVLHGERAEAGRGRGRLLRQSLLLRARRGYARRGGERRRAGPGPAGPGREGARAVHVRGRGEARRNRVGRAAAGAARVRYAVRDELVEPRPRRGGGGAARVMANMERKVVPACILCGRKDKADGVAAMALCVRAEHQEAFQAELARLVG